MNDKDIEELFKYSAVEDTDPEEVTPEEMDEKGSVEVIGGKVMEAPVGFQGLITENQDLLSESERKYQIALEGVCTGCAHCGMPLRDAVSVQRGIGPVCSKRGYKEDPEEHGDPIEAMIFLSKWPHLVNFLVKSSPDTEKGNCRTLLNGLVRICSLNRRSEVHNACTDAIETLGYHRLASMLRESLCAAQIKESKGNPNYFSLWIKRSEWTPSWSLDWRKALPNSNFSRADKGMLFLKTDKAVAWGLLKSHFLGLCIKTPDGKAVRIK